MEILAKKMSCANYDKEKALKVINKFKLFSISASLPESNDPKSKTKLLKLPTLLR
jgi:hypothetical protein